MSFSHTFQLLTHTDAGQALAWRKGECISVHQFLCDVQRLANALPTAQHVLNACGDRYRFTVLLAAALVSRKICLLPSTHTPEMITQLQAFAPDAICVTDHHKSTINLPTWHYQDLAEKKSAEVPFLSRAIEKGDETTQNVENGAHVAKMALADIFLASDISQQFLVPAIDVAQTVAFVFTSGSTGTPIAHRKTWGALVADVKAESKLLGLDDGRKHTLIGTVPPQHMYGFESTILIVLQSGNAMAVGSSFYPADICAACTDVPAPRTLITTPVHLRTLLTSGLKMPALNLLVSATAPLNIELGRQAESAFNAPLLEIYGSTETGQIAVRQSTQTAEWTLFDGVELTPKGDRTWVSGGHVEVPIVMGDVLEPTSPRQFLLHGRLADMINIAGKRNSLAYLNHQLNAIVGVQDGAFFMPAENPSRAELADTQRLCAFVVAPNLTSADILTALRTRIDAVFCHAPWCG